MAHLRINHSYNLTDKEGDVVRATLDGLYKFRGGKKGKGEHKQRIYIRMPTGIRPFTREMKSEELVDDESREVYSISAIPKEPKREHFAFRGVEISKKSNPKLMPTVGKLLTHARKIAPLVGEMDYEIGVGDDVFIRIFRKPPSKHRAKVGG